LDLPWWSRRLELHGVPIHFVGLCSAWMSCSDDDQGRLLVERQPTAERFLADEEVDSGIVVSRGHEVRFWHLTFQEYLAARALSARSDDDQRQSLFSRSKLYEPEWRAGPRGTVFRGVKRIQMYRA
jgi:hypothetical protein